MLEPGSQTVPLSHDGRDRPYLLHVPRSAPTTRVPLVIELHGRGIKAAQFDRWTGFTALAEREGFALAMPDAIGEVWNDGRDPLARPDDVGYVAALMEDVATKVPVDPRRIYLVGMSNGAAMAGRFALERPERIAAVAQVAGTAAAELAAHIRPANPVPILQIHGTADRYAPYAGGRPRGFLARAVLRGSHVVGGAVGVDDWARLWVAANGAPDGPVLESIAPDTTIRRWHGASPMSDVVFYRIEGGGHTWPGNAVPLPRFLFGRTSDSFNATMVCWAFLAAHSR